MITKNLPSVRTLVPDKRGLTEFWLLAEIVVDTVGFVAVKAVTVENGPV